MHILGVCIYIYIQEMRCHVRGGCHDYHTVRAKWLLISRINLIYFPINQDHVVEAEAVPRVVEGREWLICDEGALPLHSEDDDADGLDGVPLFVKLKDG